MLDKSHFSSLCAYFGR